jgi:hypothetical protein
MADGIDIKGAVPTVMIAAALGAGAALFTDRGTKKALTFGLVGAGIGAFAHLVLGVSLTGRGGHAVGQTTTERTRMLPSLGHSQPPIRFSTWPAKLGRTLSGGAYEVGQDFTERPGPGVMRGRVGPGVMRGRVGPGVMRARGDFGVGFDGDDDFLDDDYDACPFGYYTDLWGNCILIVFSIEREILYLYPEIIIQYPELRLHPDRLFHFRPEMRQRYAGVRSAREMRSRYQQVHRQPPPARPKDAPPVSKSAAPAQGAPHGGHGGGKHAATPAAPSATPHAPPPSAPTSPPPAHAAVTPPPLPSSPTSKQPPPQTPQAAQHAATGWYTPGWQQHFPPIAYEYNHYGPMEYWWVQPDSRFALY